MFKKGLIALLIFNVIITSMYFICDIFKIVHLSEINFSLLLCYTITTNIVIGEVILKQNNGASKGG